MFRYYGREETSFVCSLGADSGRFQRINDGAFVSICQMNFSRQVERDEFILILELGTNNQPTGNELTLFAIYATNNIAYLMVVREPSPDEFWFSIQDSPSNIKTDSANKI
jgi:hypothetical protein